MKYIDYIEFRQSGKCMYAWLPPYEPPNEREVELFGPVRYINSPLLCPFTYVSFLARAPHNVGRAWIVRVTFTKRVAEQLVIDVALRKESGSPITQVIKNLGPT